MKPMSATMKKRTTTKKKKFKMIKMIMLQMVYNTKIELNVIKLIAYS